jgi:hypothetical protein
VAVTELRLTEQSSAFLGQWAEDERQQALKAQADWFVQQGVYNRFFFEAYPPYSLSDLPVAHLKISEESRQREKAKGEHAWIRYNFHI